MELTPEEEATIKKLISSTVHGGKHQGNTDCVVSIPFNLLRALYYSYVETRKNTPVA